MGAMMALTSAGSRVSIKAVVRIVFPLPIFPVINAICEENRVVCSLVSPILRASDLKNVDGFGANGTLFSPKCLCNMIFLV